MADPTTSSVIPPETASQAWGAPGAASRVAMSPRVSTSARRAQLLSHREIWAVPTGMCTGPECTSTPCRKLQAAATPNPTTSTLARACSCASSACSDTDTTSSPSNTAAISNSGSSPCCAPAPSPSSCTSGKITRASTATTSTTVTAGASDR